MKSTLFAAALAASSFAAQGAAADTLATQGIKAALAETKAETPNDHFKIGALEAFSAIENMGQTRWRYNLGYGARSLPMMRLQLGYNKAGEQAGPEVFAELAKQFLADIAPAKASLAKAGAAGDSEFVLSLTDLWFDFNANGARDEGEDLVTAGGSILQGMAGSRRGLDLSAAEAASIRFDQSDVHWLHAYTEVLSATAHLYVAFDPADTISALALYSQQIENAPERAWTYTAQERDALLLEIEVKQAALKKEFEALKPSRQSREASATARAQIQKLEKEAEPDTAQIAQLQETVDAYAAEWKALRPEQTRNRRAQAALRAEKQGIIAGSPAATTHRRGFLGDPQMREWLNMAFLFMRAFEQTPDAAHIKAASDSMKGMIAANKRFWASVAEETDNDREWIPNPKQTAALGFELPQETGPLWQDVLGDLEKVLEGELLVPHFALPPGYGINLAKYVEAPVGLDFVGSVHASTFGPFIEKGPVVSNQSWGAFRALMGRNSFAMALLLN